MNDPSFERTRETMAEFARAGKAGKLIRLSFRELLVNAADRNLSSRLVKVLFRAINADAINGRGERTVQNGDLQQLVGFNFNNRSSLTELLYARYTVEVNRAQGQVNVAFSPFVPKVMVLGSRKTSHFSIVAAAALLDFEKDTHQYVQQSTGELPWDNLQTAPIALNMAFPIGSTLPIIVVLGIEFYTRVMSGKIYPYKGDELNAAAIVKVSHND